MLIFAILAVISVFGALMVVTRKSALTSAIYLILVMCCIAGMFATLGALFIAAMQVIVYAGAIMVLVIFVIMLLNLRDDEFGFDKRLMQKYLGLSFAALILLQAVFISIWATKDYNDIPETGKMSEVMKDAGIVDFDSYLSAESVAETLFTKFAYPFEVTSILLLTAIIGALVISKRRLAEEDDDEGGED
jgi:NADH-quinone oxidoreductase subunit J